MAQTPTGLMSLPLDHLRTLIAQSSTFQTWVGAASAAEAKSSIYLVNVPLDSMTRPFALIGFGEKWRSEKTAEIFHERRGELYLMFENDVAVADQDSEADAVFAFMNAVGGTLSDMLAVSGQDGFLNVTEIELDAQPVRVTDEDAEFEDYYTVGFNVIYSGL